MAHILVTGGNGYVGSHLVSQLLALDYQVTVVDWMVFGRHPLAAHGEHPKFRLFAADVRNLKPEVINTVDVVCDLAAIPDGVDTVIENSVNHLARRRLGLLAKALGVKRYLLAGSAEPQSEPERLAQHSLLALDDGDFAVTILRLGSAFGLSRRMRFDLALNAMVLEARRTGRIAAGSETAEKRPMLHAADAARAFIETLTLPASSTQGRTIDVFCHRLSMAQLAATVTRTLRLGVDAPEGAASEPFTGPLANPVTVEQAVMEVHIALASGRIHPSSLTRTHEVYRGLIAEGRLTASAFLEPRPRRRHA